MRHRTSTLAACALLLGLQVGCAEAAGEATPAETSAPTTSEAPATTEATTTTVDPEALAAFYAALLATTTTTAPPTTAAPVTAAPTTAPPAPPPTAAPTTPAPAPPPAQYGSGACGGDLPPCYVMMRESHGDIRIWNGGCYAPVGHAGLSPCGISDASGKWQFLRSTWAGFGGYLNAADAPEAVQDDKARQLWAGGSGCSAWSAC